MDQKQKFGLLHYKEKVLDLNQPNHKAHLHHFSCIIQNKMKYYNKYKTTKSYSLVVLILLAFNQAYNFSLNRPSALSIEQKTMKRRNRVLKESHDVVVMICGGTDR